MLVIVSQLDTVIIIIFIITLYIYIEFYVSISIRPTSVTCICSLMSSECMHDLSLNFQLPPLCLKLMPTSGSGVKV